MAKRLSEKQKEEITELFTFGKTIDQLSDEFNCQNYFNNLSCEIRDYENRIEWQVEDGQCSDDTRIFNIYYSDDNKNFKNIGYSTNTFFLHDNLSSLKGYYYVTALDRSGNESLPSDTLIRNNCPQYVLPNVFTPNEDGKNDTFSPFFSDGSITDFDYSNCPRFVRSVDISIVFGKPVTRSLPFTDIFSPEVLIAEPTEHLIISAVLSPIPSLC